MFNAVAVAQVCTRKDIILSEGVPTATLRWVARGQDQSERALELVKAHAMALAPSSAGRGACCVPMSVCIHSSISHVTRALRLHLESAGHAPVHSEGHEAIQDRSDLTSTPAARLQYAMRSLLGLQELQTSQCGITLFVI